MNLRHMARQLARDNRAWPTVLVEVERDSWPQLPAGWRCPVAVLRSRTFLCQVFEEAGGVIRLSVNRTMIDEVTGRWDERITWDELQALKEQAGFGEREAVEVYPPSDQIVNVANMRHLWVLPERLPFSWGQGAGRPTP